MDGEIKKKMKRFCRGDVDENGDGNGDEGFGLWEGLNPEILALIFIRIAADELVRVVPFVCKSWREVVAGPYCWSDIDIEQWCRRCNRPEKIDLAVRKLIRRSKGTFRRLSVYKLTNSGFCFVANCGKHLKVLQIPMSGVNDKMVEKHAEALPMVTFLDISYCLQLTCKGLEVLGKSCKSLTYLRRNMPPPEWPEAQKLGPSKANDEEALVIAETMPGLHRLELAYGRFGDLGLNAILTKCKDLIHLDILGSVSVQLNGDLSDKCEQLKVFKGPWDDDYDDLNSSGSDGDVAEVEDSSSDSD
ncbi:hypothetical protein BVC80_917g62 [Macleaya cordata]|uniref:Uncharacterized protein n=1 Tax=Macleaya cordata TaxID=56857 RepID=A0A200QJ72_MACCD|nr:hypothetical protein BVC80_917g62 [Macleaya cordata]